MLKMCRLIPQAVGSRALWRHGRSTYHPRMLTTRLLTRPISTRLPSIESLNFKDSVSDSYQLLSSTRKAGPAEDDFFNRQVVDVQDWWASPRFQGIKRPYSAEDVVSKRGTLQQQYPSSLMARKLFNLLEAKSASEEPLHTRKSPLNRIREAS